MPAHLWYLPFTVHDWFVPCSWRTPVPVFMLRSHLHGYKSKKTMHCLKENSHRNRSYECISWVSISAVIGCSSCKLVGKVLKVSSNVSVSFRTWPRTWGASRTKSSSLVLGLYDKILLVLRFVLERHDLGFGLRLRVLDNISLGATKQYFLLMLMSVWMRPYLYHVTGAPFVIG